MQIKFIGELDFVEAKPQRREERMDLVHDAKFTLRTE